ncbi:MAG: hypothetical protein LC650_05100 [Actinobacteria bacterium]|nr:hypothetical protein [Actinomycetota bacterium]
MLNPEIDEIVEEHVIDVIKQNTDYNVVRFYQSLNPQELYQFIHARLNSALGSVYVRVNDLNATAVDTIGEAYNVTAPIEIVVAYPAHREKALNRKRTVNDMKNRIREILIENPVQIGSDEYFMYWSGGSNLFRDSKIDARLVRFEVPNIYSEII